MKFSSFWEDNLYHFYFATGGFDKWRTITAIKPITLVKDENSQKYMRVVQKYGDVFWLNWFKLEKRNSEL